MLAMSTSSSGLRLANVARVDQLELVEADDRPRSLDGRRWRNGRVLAVETPSADEGPDRRIEAAIARRMDRLCDGE